MASADRDLGLRLLNGSTSTWWTLSASATMSYPGAGGPPTRHHLDGRLKPILQDGLGNPMVAVWVPADADQRWYIVPDGADGDLVVEWLVQQALPAYVPHALRRVRSPHFIDKTYRGWLRRAPRQSWRRCNGAINPAERVWTTLHLQRYNKPPSRMGVTGRRHSRQHL